LFHQHHITFNTNNVRTTKIGIAQTVTNNNIKISTKVSIMQSTIFVSLATGQYYTHGGLQNLIKSAKHFYPSVPFCVINDTDVKQLVAENPNYNLGMGYLHCLIGKQFAKSYELVIYVDSDSLIVAPLTEVFEDNYEIAGVRNNADNGMTGCSQACTFDSVGWREYVNGGFTACRNARFWDDWMQLNMEMPNTRFWEQDTLNTLFYSGKYKSLLLDPIESNIHYGISSVYGTQTHWDSWKDIIVQDGKLMLNDKHIKILHQAGGSGAFPKMDIYTFGFNQDVMRYFHSIGVW